MATPASDRNKSDDERIQHAVVEFLRYHGMKNTIECFEIEAQQKLKASTQLLSPRSGGKGPDGMRFRVKREMLACFDDGLSGRFFASWDKHVAMDLRDNDKTARKLEFNLQLHFATLPFRPSFLRKMAQAQRNNPRAARSAAGVAASAMINFRKYLESRGKVLSNSPEFLQYYALPYVPNPVEHPSFKAVFKPQWPLDIRIRLERFLEVVLQSVTLPELYQVFDNTDNMMAGMNIDGQPSLLGGNSGGAGASHSQSTDDIRRMTEQIRAQFLSREDKLKDFARNIYAVSVEMLRELERAASRSGQPVRPEFVTFAKSRLEMFNEVLAQKGLTSLSNKLANSNISAGVKTSEGKMNSEGKSGAGGGPALDFGAARDDLTKLSDLIVEHNAGAGSITSRKAARLLQALRWKLNRTRPRVARKALLQKYISSDILGCTSTAGNVSGNTAPDLLMRLLEMKNNGLVLEYACRFVNLIASDSEGRTYLLQHRNIIKMLVDILKSEQTDSIARQNALGALQKFSLRRRAQTIMIEEDLIAWIASVLREHTDPSQPDKELSEYTVEYATALLMNLSVRTLGKIKCEDPEVKILDAMNNLLENENIQVRSYVNGTLYSVLSRPTLRERALQMGMDEMMKQLMKDADEEFRTQVEYILEQLENESTAEDVSDGEEEDDADDPDEDMEDDEDIDDEDEGESLDPPTENEIAGDDLLSLYLMEGGNGPEQATQQRAITVHAQQQMLESQQQMQSTGISNDGKSPGARDELGMSLTKAEATRNETVMSVVGDEDGVNFMSKPRILRTPQNGMGLASPGEFDMAQESQQAPSFGEKSESEKVGVRYAKADGLKPDYIEGFSNKPKLNRTPQTGLYAAPGEFGPDSNAMHK